MLRHFSFGQRIFAVYDSHMSCQISLKIKIFSIESTEKKQNKLLRILNFEGPRENVNVLNEKSKICNFILANILIPYRFKHIIIIKNCRLILDHIHNTPPKNSINYSIKTAASRSHKEDPNWCFICEDCILWWI